MQNDLLNQPTVVVPDRLFLIGALYGFNAGRRFNEPKQTSSQPIYTKSEHPQKLATNQDDYFGHWFQVECISCKHTFYFDEPNQIPHQSLICPTCNNTVILFGSLNTNEWHIGPIKL